MLDKYYLEEIQTELESLEIIVKEISSDFLALKGLFFMTESCSDKPEGLSYCFNKIREIRV